MIIPRADSVLDDLYMFGNSIGLSGIPETGSYEFGFKVTETNSDTSSERSVSVEPLLQPTSPRRKRGASRKE